jgi:hypothetical protein
LVDPNNTFAFVSSFINQYSVFVLGSLAEYTHTREHHSQQTHTPPINILFAPDMQPLHMRDIHHIPSDYAHLFLYLGNSMADSTLLITTRLSSFRLSNANIQALTAAKCVQG